MDPCHPCGQIGEARGRGIICHNLTNRACRWMPQSANPSSYCAVDGSCTGGGFVTRHRMWVPRQSPTRAKSWSATGDVYGRMHLQSAQCRQSRGYLQRRWWAIVTHQSRKMACDRRLPRPHHSMARGNRRIPGAASWRSREGKAKAAWHGQALPAAKWLLPEG